MHQMPKINIINTLMINHLKVMTLSSRAALTALITINLGNCFDAERNEKENVAKTLTRSNNKVQTNNFFCSRKRLTWQYSSIRFGLI